MEVHHLVRESSSDLVDVGFSLLQDAINNQKLKRPANVEAESLFPPLIG